MAVTIQDLINQKIFPDIKLVAGQKGLRNEILWINIMEILDTPSSVQLGELLFTTGYGLQEEAQHRDLIPQLVKQGVSGLAVQTGYYIDSVPQYILNQAEDLGFPVIVIPKHLTFSEILHTMTQLVTPKAQSSWGHSDLKQAHSLLEQMLTEQADNISPDNEEQCVHVILLDTVGYTEAEAGNWSKCLAQVFSYLQSNSDFFQWHELPQHKYVGLLAHSNTSDALSTFYALSIKLTLLSEQFGTNCHMGVDRIFSTKGAALALSHTTDALSTLQSIRARRGVCHYDHIKFIKVLGQMHRDDGSVALDNQALQMLLNYDRLNNSNYVQTLRVYLSNNCNMTQTARQLFLHRHTLIKRLAKISSIGNLNLDDYYTRIYMSVALLFHDYFVY